MSEQDLSNVDPTNIPAGEPSGEPSAAPKAPEFSPTQLEAMEAGWRPKEEYEGDNDKWVDAGEFLRRGELFKKIESQSKELKDVKKAMDAFKKHHEQVAANEYKRALEALKADKKEALLSGDADKLLDIEDEIDSVKEQMRNAEILARETQAQSNEPHPEFQAWQNRNKWYDVDVEMRQFADNIGTAHARATGKSPAEVLKYVEQKVREAYPSKFRNPNQDKPGAVEGGRSSAPANSDADITLTDEEKRVMNTFVRTGVMSKADYIKELKRVKGL